MQETVDYATLVAAFLTCVKHFSMANADPKHKYVYIVFHSFESAFTPPCGESEDSIVPPKIPQRFKHKTA